MAGADLTLKMETHTQVSGVRATCTALESMHGRKVRGTLATGIVATTKAAVSSPGPLKYAILPGLTRPREGNMLAASKGVSARAKAVRRWCRMGFMLVSGSRTFVAGAGLSNGLMAILTMAIGRMIIAMASAFSFLLMGGDLRDGSRTIFPARDCSQKKTVGAFSSKTRMMEKGMCFLILAVRATGTSFAVKYDPAGKEEIERLPPPIEKNEMGRREYVGPRYSMSASNAKENRLLLSPPTQAQTPIEMYEDQNRALRRASRSAPAQEKADSGNSSSSPGCNAVDENCDSRHQTSPLDQNMPLSPTTLQGETCLPVGHENISVQYRAVNPTTMGGMSIDTEKAAFPAVTAPVAVCIKLGLDFNMSVGEEGSSKRTMFEKELILDIANAADLPLPCFQVTHLQAGSVFAEIDILSKDGSDPFAAAALLVRQADAPGSSLLKGKLTRFLEAAYCPLLNLSAGSKEDVIQLGKVCSRVTRYAASRMRAASVDEASDSGSVQVPCREHVPETWPTSRLEAFSAEMSENVFRGLMAPPQYQHSDHFPSQPSQPPLVQKDVVRLQRSAGPNGTCDTVMLPVSRGGGGELGLAITRLPRGIIVSDKKTGSPAAYSHNLRVGDEIIKVDNVLVKHLPVQEVFELHPCLSLITFYRKPCTS